MAGRGWLIRPVNVVIARLDPAATEAAGNYDASKRSVKVARPFGARGPKQQGRRELAEITIKAQVEVLNINRQRQGPGGDVPDYRTVFVAHYRDLERASLVGADGHPLIGNRDRIVRMETKFGKPLRTFSNPEVFITEARDGNGWLGYDRNLLILVTDDRPKGRESVG